MQIRRLAAPKSGFTLLEIIIVVTIVGLLASIAVSNFVVARESSRLRTIRHNLRKIEEAKEQWAMDMRQPDGAPIEDLEILAEYFRGGDVHKVMEETYYPNALGTPATAGLPPGIRLGPYGPGDTIPAP